MSVVKLEALRYESYGMEDFYRVKSVAPTLMEALKKIANYGCFYITSEQIEEDTMSEEDIIDNLVNNNADGCDEIFYLEIDDELIIGEIEEVI